MRGLIAFLMVVAAVPGSGQLIHWSHVIPDTDRVRVLPISNGRFVALTSEQTVNSDRAVARFFDSNGVLTRTVTLFEEWKQVDYAIEAATADAGRVYLCVSGLDSSRNRRSYVASCDLVGENVWTYTGSSALPRAAVAKNGVLYVAEDYTPGQASDDRARITRYDSTTGLFLGSNSVSNTQSYASDLALGPGNILYLGGRQNSVTAPAFIARLRDDGTPVFFRTFLPAANGWIIPYKLGFDVAQSRVYLAGVASFDIDLADHFIVGATTTSGAPVANMLVDLGEGQEEFGGFLVNSTGIYIYRAGYNMRPLRKLKPNLTTAWEYADLGVLRGTVAPGFHNDVFLCVTDFTDSWIKRLDATDGSLLSEVPMGPSPIGSPSGIIPEPSGAFLEWGGSTYGFGSSRSYLQKNRQGLLTFPVSAVIGGNAVTGTITLPTPALANTTFSLTSANASVLQVPASVTVPVGATSVDFNATTSPLANNASVLVTASARGAVLQKSLAVVPATISSISVSPNSVFGGIGVSGTVFLTGKAPTGGVVVSLMSNSPAVTVPNSVMVVAGTASVGFAVASSPVLVNTGVVLSGTFGTISKTVFMAVNAPTLDSVGLTPSSVKGGTSVTLGLSLGSPAPSGYVVKLVSGAPALVIVPSSIAMTPGSATRSLSISTVPVTTTINVTVIAYRGPYVRTSVMTITP